MNIEPLDKIAEARIAEAFCYNLDLVAIENRMKELKTIEIEPEHIFAGGVYIRQIKIPKGTLIVGKRHRNATCNILMSGEMVLYVGNGEPPVKLRGPFLFESGKHVKKLFYCTEESVFMTVHPSEPAAVEDLEDRFIIPEEDFLKGTEQ